jgi:hypothetical protein
MFLIRERKRERERESHHSLPSCIDQHRVSKQKQEQKAPATNLSAHVYSVPACHNTKNEIRQQNLPKKISAFFTIGTISRVT